MPKKKVSVAEKKKRRLEGGYPLSTGKTPASPPKTGSPGATPLTKSKGMATGPEKVSHTGARFRSKETTAQMKQRTNDEIASRRALKKLDD